MYARHGRELLGSKSPVREPVYVSSINEVLNEGNCISARRCGKEAGDQSCESTDTKEHTRPMIRIRRHHTPTSTVQDQG